MTGPKFPPKIKTMRRIGNQRLTLALLVWAWIMATAAGGVAAEPTSAAVSFERQIVPLLQQRCFSCHEGRDPVSGYRLDLKAELLGEAGGLPLVVPGKSTASRLIEVVSGRDPQVVMPPKGPRLSAAEISLLERWIDGGLAWNASILPERDDAERHWAFRRIERPALSRGSAGSPVDSYLAAAFAQLQMQAAPEADGRTLARRVYLDLTGLPPTWDALSAFLDDRRPDAWERLIDRLLAAPQYGERWGRHWLDVARWAESEGYESNHPRPFAWRYRDYVVAAFNGDKPYDAFLRQQIAGDELPEYSDENLIATGFLAAARLSSNEEDRCRQRNDVTVDIVNAVGSAVLGLTWHCAQCHNHKFDPLSARDYYRLHAFFARGMPLNARLSDPALVADYAARRPIEYEPALALKEALFEKARQRAIAAERARLSAAERAAVDLPPANRSPDEELLARKASQRFVKGTGEIERHLEDADRKLYDEVKKRLADLEKRSPAPPQTFAFYSPVTSPHRVDVLPSIGFYPLPYDPVELASLRTYVMIRGDVHGLGPTVTPGWPQALGGGSVTTESPSEGGRNERLTRRDLADWLTARDNPLVARVWANRIWQQHFGRGIVATPDDFGLRGAWPSHPELLDWLAAELLENGWSTKRIHRRIFESAAYRQGGRNSPEILQRDPDNHVLARFAPRRLEAEALRDAALAVSGELVLALGGPSVPLDEREASVRRSVYLFQRRGQPAEMQRLFDGPSECSASVGARHVSTSALQSLYLLNGDFTIQRARALAALVTEDSSIDPITAAFRRVLLREPSADERSAAEKLCKSASADPLELLCQALLNLNEFAYLE